VSVIFCSSCVGKLTKIDLERSFEILNAILQFDYRFLPRDAMHPRY